MRYYAYEVCDRFIKSPGAICNTFEESHKFEELIDNEKCKKYKKQKDEVVGALNEARKLAKELARRDDEGGSGKDLLKRARICSARLYNLLP